MSQPIRILIIEDSEDDAALLRRELERGGYRFAAERVETIDALRAALGRTPDVILSDFQLGSFTALDALRIAQELGVHAPLIVVSGTIGEDVAVEAMRAGARDYFRKEHLERLGPAIDRELRQRRGLAEARAQNLSLEDRLYATVKAAPIPIAVVEGADHVYTFRNRAHVALFGHADLLGRSRRTARAEASIDDELLDRVYRTGDTLERRALRARVPGPNRRDRDVVLHVVLLPVRGGDGHVAGVTIIATDITREAELRERTEQARREAENANRMKDEFLATLSHELRTPLNAMLGWTMMLKQGALEPAKHARALQVIERSAREQARLIDDLLDVSRIVTGKLTVHPRAMDLDAVVAAAVDAARIAADAKRIVIDQRAPGIRLPVFGDPDRLHQVLWNLLSNAIKFTPSGGRVTIDLAHEGSTAAVVVADTGAGIDPAFLPYVFERFRQADSSSTRRFGGLGIGLTIAKQIVELHGGTLDAESAGAGRGTTVTLRMPVRQVAFVPAAPESGTELAPVLTGVRVLVVDADPESRARIVSALEAHGAVAAAAATAADAIERPAAWKPEWKPDVLVVDVSAAGEDASTLVQRLRANEGDGGAWLPALALTASLDVGDARRAIRAGYQLHVPKPVDVRRVVRVVAELATWSPSRAAARPT